MRQAPDPAAAFARIWTRKECLVKLSLARLDEVTSVDLEEAPGATGVMFADITGTHPAVASLAWTDPTRRSDGRSRQPSVARRPRRA